jgi:choline kinase
MPFFTSPQALRLRELHFTSPSFVAMGAQSNDYGGNGFMHAFKNKHSSHPDFANLTLLVFEAVMEVVCVSLPGYIVARMGQFDAENQKCQSLRAASMVKKALFALASRTYADLPVC